jgi:uncharacterized protein (DUF362 family)
MEKFANFITVFSEANERNILYLQSVYKDFEKLKKYISLLSSECLTESVIKNKKILIKPNWVKHSKTEADEICLRTHDQFLLAVLEVILEKRPSEVVIGDAPIQGAVWDKILHETLINCVQSLSEKYKIKISIKDFRRTTFNPAVNRISKERQPDSDYLIFDLGKSSSLEPITAKARNQFRVTQYDPDRMTQVHQPGTHKYCITKELVNADIIISLPKIKTHQKTGITGTLKNLVGFNGDKDFLPHHRLGGTQRGGDCYPGGNLLRYWAELMQDKANRRIGEKYYRIWIRLSSLLWKLSFPGDEHSLGGGWYGNDTTWRMVQDLNYIVTYGNSEGSFSRQPQRTIYSFCDGIIGGQGDGPLNPEPLPLGVLCFTNSSLCADRCFATLMGFDFEKIPLLDSLNNASDNDNTSLKLNNNEIVINDLKNYAISTLPSRGWKNHLLINLK